MKEEWYPQPKVKIKNLKPEECPCGGKFIRTRGESQICCPICIKLGHRGVKTICNTLQHVKEGLWVGN